MSGPFIVRNVLDTDLNYIYETWLADLREADSSFLPNDLWFPAHRECLTRVLSAPQTRTYVLADSVDKNIIYGYLVRDDNYLHWIHIRRGQWRKRGLAKYLLQETQSLSLPLVWRTKLGHERLQGPVKSRLARHAWWSTVDRSAP